MTKPDTLWLARGMMIQGKDGRWYQVPDHLFGDRDGRTFVRGLDRFALDTQAGLTFVYMSTHGWVTPEEVAQAIGWEDWDHGSVTARIRDFRKVKFGGYRVERRRVIGSRRLHEYRLMGPEEESWQERPSPTSTPPHASTEAPSPSRPPSTHGWRIAPSSP